MSLIWAAWKALRAESRLPWGKGNSSVGAASPCAWECQTSWRPYFVINVCPVINLLTYAPTSCFSNWTLTSPPSESFTMLHARKHTPQPGLSSGPPPTWSLLWLLWISHGVFPFMLRLIVEGSFLSMFLFPWLGQSGSENRDCVFSSPVSRV